MEWAEASRTFWPHNNPLKSCCPAPRKGRRILTFSGLNHGRLSLVSQWVPRFLRLPMARSWRFVINAFFLGIARIASIYGMCIQWRLHEAARIWKLKVPLGIRRDLFCLTFLLWTVCVVSFPRFRLLYKAPWEDHLPYPLALELYRSSKFIHSPWTKKMPPKSWALQLRQREQRLKILLFFNWTRKSTLLL